MIKLKCQSPPTLLTAEKVIELTSRYDPITQKPSVWLDNVSKVDIQFTLFGYSKGKCAYCERIPKEGGDELEIDHYLPKCDYPELVVCWYNLLPSCNSCNNKKLTHNSITETEIVNPFWHNPKEHFIMELNGDLEGKTPEGIFTEDKLNLNDIMDYKFGLSALRGDIIRSIRAELAEIMKDINKINEKGTTPQRRTLAPVYTHLYQLMEDVLPNPAPEAKAVKFVAAKATAILHPKSNYWKIKDFIESHKYTEDEIKKIHNLEHSINKYSLAQE